MAPRTKEQFAEIRENRKEQIMQVALELFASEGYAHCSISKLAENIGISKGLMYNYFDSKEDLLGAILEKGMQEFLQFFDQNRDGVLTPDELEFFLRKTFQLMRSKQEFWILYSSLAFQPKVTEQLRNHPTIRKMGNYYLMLHKYFEAKGCEDPDLEVLTISAMIEGLGAMMIYTYPEMAIPDEILEKYEERVIKMFK
jgi:AcrR family transcriptional regulator